MAEPLLWELLTHDEIRKLREDGMDMAILPVGSTEQHGLHLSVNVDTLCVKDVAWDVSRKTGVPVLPVLPYGTAWGHTHKWPGTLSLSPATLTAAVTEIGEWLLLGSGFTKLLILSGHTTNCAALRSALETLRYKHPEMSVASLGLWNVSTRVAEAYTSDAADWHANSAETSLMLARCPEAVHRDMIEDDPDRTEGLFFSYPVDKTSTNGLTGKPSLSTKEAGDELFGWIVDDLSIRVLAALKEHPPL